MEHERGRKSPRHSMTLIRFSLHYLTVAAVSLLALWVCSALCG
jgi:hypothetical protein